LVPRQKSLPGRDPGAIPRVADAEILADLADPGKVEEAQADLLRHRQRLRDQSGIEGGDQGAVGGRPGRQILYRFETRGARHVLHDDRGTAGDVTGEVAGEYPRVDVVAAARRKTDHDSHRLAALEARPRLPA